MRMHDVITDEHEMGKCAGPGKCCLCPSKSDLEEYQQSEIEEMQNNKEVSHG